MSLSEQGCVYTWPVWSQVDLCQLCLGDSEGPQRQVTVKILEIKTSFPLCFSSFSPPHSETPLLTMASWSPALLLQLMTFTPWFSTWWQAMQRMPTSWRSSGWCSSAVSRARGLETCHRSWKPARPSVWQRTWTSCAWVSTLRGKMARRFQNQPSSQVLRRIQQSWRRLWESSGEMQSS